MSMWLGIAVESTVAWPTTDAVVKFQGHDITLRAATDSTLPSVETEYSEPVTGATAHLVLRRFLSSLVWAEGQRIKEVLCLGGGHRVRFGRGEPCMVLSPRFRADYLPDPSDPKAQLAMALYREALGLSNQPYQFLGFFKIINVLHSSGKQQRAWITKVLPKLREHRAVVRLRELEKTEADLPMYLYESGRCAVAHAFSEPLVDPDRLEDYRRLSADLPVIRALAEYLIEHELKVKSSLTVRSQHLYELEGFRRMLGPEVVAVLKAGERPDTDALPSFPDLSVRLRGESVFRSFEGLRPGIVEAHEGCIVLVVGDQAGSVQLALTLHFAGERLMFDPEADIRIQDDGSAACMQAAIDHARLLGGMVANGELEVWQTEPEELLGRCDPCLFVNTDSRRTADRIARRVEVLEEELRRRKAGE